MGIQDDNATQAPLPKPQPAPNSLGGAAARSGVEIPRPARQAESGVQSLPNLLRKSPIGLSGFGEAVKKLNNTIKEIMRSDGGEDSDLRFHVLDSQQHGTSLSCIVVTAGAIRGTQSFVAAHTLIVEASGGRLPKIIMNQGSQQLELTATAGDVYNNAMWEKVKQLVATNYPANSQIRDASSTVIPLEMALDDVDHVRKVLFYAIQAVYMHLENATNTPIEPFCVKYFTRQDRVSAKVDFTPQPLETTTGLPVRSDVSVILNAASTVTNQQDLMPSAGKDFSRVDGYVDLVYQQPPRPGYGQQPVTQHYHPRLVMTNFAPLLEGVNLELLLLALSSSTLLSRGNNFAWAGVYRPKYGTELNLRNIGAIGLEIPALVGSQDGKGAIIDTQASTFTMDSLYQLLTTAIHPNLIYSFDVEESSSLSFVHMMFIAAASGAQDAHLMLIDAANRLTDGAFAHHFAGGPVVLDDNNRIHLGYYTDAKGNRKDIREVDYLAVLNMVGKNDMSIPVKWANTFDRTDIPLEVRMDERERLLNSLIGAGSMRITGYARRITFAPTFMAALDAGLVDAGLIIQPGNQQFFFGDQVVRGNDNIGQFAFAGGHAASLFNYSNPQVSGRAMQGIQGRWNRT